MSGEKRTPIQILQDDMRENRRQLHSIQKQREQLHAELKKVQKQNKAEVTTLKTQLNERSRKQEAAIGTLKSEMRDMATQHSRQMMEQRNAIMQELEDLEMRTDDKVENLRDWARERLEEQRTEYRRISQEQQLQINILKRDIEQINQREENREQRAKDYLADLEVLIRSAEENLPHERYAQGRLDKIKRQLAAAQRQLNEDVPAATIATVQNAHFDLMDLEEEILRKETEYEMTYRTVADAVGGLLSAVRQNRNIHLEDSDNAQEADYWTEGRYLNLEERIAETKKHIEQNRHLLTVEELNRYLDDLEALTSEQEKLVEEAVERIISSQLRAEMGDTVVETLGRQGYRIKNNECGYSENDQRGSYMVKLSNVAGTEIVTVISPDEETYQNVISINTYGDEVYDEAATRKRSEDIRNALTQGGLQLGETQCNEQSISEFYDVENLIKKGGKKLPKQVLKTASGLASSSETKTASK
ncbi:MAG: hypothetical protein CV087_19675 [Candidatus Brocadia sp. WS118]|nr:MAG: hypothetical protein CV087_19675 [Candidatus Brocadia sp. WS118]